MPPLIQLLGDGGTGPNFLPLHFNSSVITTGSAAISQIAPSVPNPVLGTLTAF